MRAVSLEDSVPCPDCGAPARWHGLQALVGDSLRWDTETVCPECGAAVAVCGREVPDDVRPRLLIEHGAAVLRLEPPVDRVAVMRVLRRELDLGPAQVGSVLERVLTAGYEGTLPEIELLARRLRDVGVGAAAVWPRGGG
ncbi:hypothetical protein ABT124_27095 [Streptomyces sp. NPDC001982]|uniref:hypothetical protein n=1 Tax=unclassified Streptomyces TaxID=2593676 RepID=UPI00332979B3